MSKRRLLYLFLGAFGATDHSYATDYQADAQELRLKAGAYEHGRGVVHDFKEAYRLYCKAALLGDPEAAYNLGWMYFNGRGVRHDPGVAVGWFRQAARAGDAYAVRMLARYDGIQDRDDKHCKPDIQPFIVEVDSTQSGITQNNPDRRFIESLVAQIAPIYSVDPALVLAVIQAESGFRLAALSNKNAQGLMQLIPATASRFGVSNIWNPRENIKGGTRYLSWLLRHFEGNVKWTLAAYNAGEKAVEQYGGVPPYRETQNYVNKILAYYQKTTHPVPPQ